MKKILGIILLLLVNVSFFGQDREEVISLLNELDAQKTRFGNEISLIEKFNFGIPGGINWLVQWYEKYNTSTHGPHIYTMIYVVDTNTKDIKFRELISLNDDISPYLFSYYHNLSENIKTDNICHIGDFNRDGFDEILQLGTSRLVISGYDPQTNEIKRYCSIPYGYVEEGYDSPPVEFITYKGIKGFKLRYFEYEVAGGSGWVPDPSPKNGKWFFFAWDDRQRKFVEIEEFVEEGAVNTIQPVLGELDTVELAEEREVQEDESFIPADSDKDHGFNLYIVTIVGIIALAAITGFIVLRRKQT